MHLARFPEPARGAIKSGYESDDEVAVESVDGDGEDFEQPVAALFHHDDYASTQGDDDQAEAEVGEVAVPDVPFDEELFPIELDPLAVVDETTEIAGASSTRTFVPHNPATDFAKVAEVLDGIPLPPGCKIYFNSGHQAWVGFVGRAQAPGGHASLVVHGTDEAAIRAAHAAIVAAVEPPLPPPAAVPEAAASSSTGS